MMLSTADAKLCLLGCIWLLLSGLSSAQENITQLEQFVDLIRNVRKYDYSLPPINANNNGQPVHVNLSMYVTNIGQINELEMDYTITVYLRHLWVDYRLEFADEIPNLDSIALPDSYYSDLWIPDTFVENGKSEKMHNVTQPNRGYRVYSNGTVFNSQRITLTLWCPVGLTRFPMDSQTCWVTFMSYRYTVSEMVLQWEPNTAIEGLDKLNLTAFELVQWSKDTCVSEYSTGGYGCLRASFRFERKFGYYMAQIYAPSILIIVLSWVSFWLDPFSVPARITLGVLTILTMASQTATAASSSLPKVSYTKAIDVWLTACLTFLFAALLEFALVHTFARNISVNTQPRVKGVGHGAAVQASDAEVSSTDDKACRCCAFCSKSPNTLDKISRIAFPLTFLAFNAFYWGFYLTPP